MAGALSLALKPAPISAPAEERQVAPERVIKRSKVRRHVSNLGVGVDVGSNAVFGNSLSAHYDPIHFLELRSGLGWNTSGVKIGVGTALNLPIAAGFGCLFGGGFVRSTGNLDKVSVPAKFTPEGSTSSEGVTAMKKFKIYPATYGAVFVGGYLNFAEALRLSLEVNWNKVVAGNTVEFIGATEFDHPIDVSNEIEMQSKFDAAAKKKLDTNGTGFSVGIQLRL